MKQGWEIRKLGDVLKVQNGYAFNSKQFTTETGTPLIRIRDIKEGIGTETNFKGPYDKKYEVKAGDFLIGMDGEFGCYEWKGDKALLNQRVCRLQEFSNRLHSRFLFYGINKYLKAIENVTAFATVKHISSKQIEAIEFPLPPLPEQQRIVAILDEAFAAIAKAKANAEQNLKNAKELFESYFEGVFENKGEGWEEKKFKELIDVKHGFAFLGEFFSDKGEYVLLTPGNFYEKGGYRERGEKQKYYVGNIPPDYILKKGDLLVAMTEQAAGLLGSPILVPDSEKYLHNQRLGLIIPKSGIPFDNEFFYHAFNLNRVRKSLHESGTGVKVRHTSPTKIGEVVINFPKSKKEQETIVQILDALSAKTKKLEAIYQQKINDLEELKKSVLQKAFNGELKTATASVV